MLQKMNSKEIQNNIKELEKELKKYEKNDFNVFFYVIDTKGTPSGSLAYIYELAKILNDMGYNV